MELNDFYSELLLEYSQNPKYRGEIENPSFTEELLNPLCGDLIRVQARLADEKIEEVKYTGKGCAISQASAGILCELMTGKTKDEAFKLIKLFEGMILGKNEEGASIEALEDAMILEGLSKLPGRQRCVLLAWENLKSGMEDSEDDD